MLHEMGLSLREDESGSAVGVMSPRKVSHVVAIL